MGTGINYYEKIYTLIRVFSKQVFYKSSPLISKFGCSILSLCNLCFGREVFPRCPFPVCAMAKIRVEAATPQALAESAATEVFNELGINADFVYSVRRLAQRRTGFLFRSWTMGRGSKRVGIATNHRV